jgi:hypothetical protein
MISSGTQRLWTEAAKPSTAMVSDAVCGLYKPQFVTLLMAVTLLVAANGCHLGGL